MFHTHPCAFVYLHPTGVLQHLTQIPYLRPRATQPFSSSCSWDDLCDPPARLGHLHPVFPARVPAGNQLWPLQLRHVPTSIRCHHICSNIVNAGLGKRFLPVSFLILALGPQLFLTDLIFFAAVLGSQKIGAESTEISQVSIPLRSDFRI